MTLTLHQKEFALQVAAVRHIENAFPGLAFTAFPGRPGDAKDGFMKRKMGVKPGMPDLIFTWNDGQLRGGLIELKTDTGRISNDQNRIMSTWYRLGWKTAVCKSVREVHDTLIRWGHATTQTTITEPDYRTWDDKRNDAFDFYKPLD